MEDDFAAYFSARSPALRRLAFTLCGDWHTADDLVQVTFVKLYRHWRRLPADGVDAYVRRILVNTFLSHRHNRRREQVMAEPPDTAVLGPQTQSESRAELMTAL